MDKRTRTALEGSIAKWEAIVAGTGEDDGPQNCPLCHEFFDELDARGRACSGCPVRMATGQTGCEGSPYDDWCDLFYATDHPPHVPMKAETLEQQRLAQAEVDFLRSLLPPETEMLRNPGAYWQPISRAPRDREIEVLCPPREGLPELISKCLWHPDAGFCVDELREPTHWRKLQGDSK